VDISYSATLHVASDPDLVMMITIIKILCQEKPGIAYIVSLFSVDEENTA